MIQVEVHDANYYALRLLKGRNWQKDYERANDLPERRAIWQPGDGGSSFSHWLIPRIDVSQIMKRWHRDEVDGDKGFYRDAKLYRKLITPPDPANSFTGELNLPKSLILRPHQDAYVRGDHSRLRVVNQMGTGQGKTICCLARTQVLGFKRLVIFTILSVFDEWVPVIKQITGLTPILYVGPKRKKHLDEIAVKENCVVLSTYDVGSELDFEWDSIIWDEADMLTNPDSKRVKRFMPIIDRSLAPNVQTQVLTATIMGQRAGTVWLPCYILHPLVAGSRTAFQLYHEKSLKMIERKMPVRMSDGSMRYVDKKIKIDVQFQNQKMLLKRLNAFTFHTPEVKFNFKHTERNVMVEPTEAQLDALEELREEMSLELENHTINVSDARVLCLRVMQCLESLGNFDPELKEESGKLHYLRSMFNKTKEKKILWSRFTFLPNQLFEEYKDRSVLFTGAISREQKTFNRLLFNGAHTEEEKQLFYQLREKWGVAGQKPGSAQFFLGVLANQTSRGLNLQSAQHQLFSSMSLSGRVYVQTRGRILRLSQTADKVLTERLISHDMEANWIQYVLNRVRDASLTSAGMEKITSSAIRDLLRMGAK